MSDAEHRERTREGVRRARQRRRVTIADVDRYRLTHEVPASLAPIVEHRAQEALQLVTDLGGDPSAAQVALVDQAQQAAVIRCAAFLAWVRDPEKWGGKALDRFLSASNVERGALAALGLERRQTPVESLQDYIQRRSEEEGKA